MSEARTASTAVERAAALFRRCPTTGLQVHRAADALIRANAVAATVALLVAALTLGCTSSEPTAAPTAAPPDTVDEAASTWAERQLREMTLDEKIAHLFIIRLDGYFQNAESNDYRETTALVEEFGAGGMMFGPGTPMTQITMANDLQRKAERPLLVSQDTEWGVGMRIDEATTFPPAMALGATRDPALAYRILALNTEKAHNLKERALEAVRMEQGLAEVDPERPETDYALELERIRDRRRPRGPLAPLRAAGEALLGCSASIRAATREPADYSVVALATPACAGRLPAPMRAYVRRHAPAFPRVAFLCRGTAPSARRIERSLASLCAHEPVATLAVSARVPGDNGREAALAGFARALADAAESHRAARPSAG